MKVLVDDREALLLKYLGKNYPVQKVRLPLGDMIIARDNGSLVLGALGRLNGSCH